MSPHEFVEKWQGIEQKERSTAQTHFNDLCALLDVPAPLTADPGGAWYAFEKGATKSGGGEGWADVWKKGCFAWEYKGKHKDLDKAYAQLQQYAVALENPPLLVVSDIERIRVITNWTNTVSVRHEIKLEDLLKPEARQLLKQVFEGDERLRTGASRAELTQKVARQFGDLAQELQREGHDPLQTAHFVNRLVFCLFAEDVGILPDRLFTKLLDNAVRKPEIFAALAEQLFGQMHTGGFFGADPIAWFNGGLFDNDHALPLMGKQIRVVQEAAKLDWSAIDPAIFGTLFERGLDPAKRSQLGAHYTDPENIMRIVEPVVLRPLREEWMAARAQIEAAKQPAKKRELLAKYLARLRAVTVLDPACGSGNFLYLALRGLKDLEHFVLLDAETLGLGRAIPELGPECVRGIELSPYAAELARVTVWIGELQWQIEHGYDVDRNPVLKSLETIENRDALVQGEIPEIPFDPENPHIRYWIVATLGMAKWPDAEFIIGNPPFLGGKLLRRELGDAAVDNLFLVYDGRVPREADLCAYWFERARDQIEQGKSRRAGLIATQGIRGGANRKVLERIKETGDIFLAWSDLDWVLNGAAVHVSIVGFGGGENEIRNLNGQAVPEIHANLSSSEHHTAKPLTPNLNIAQQGTKQVGEFSLEGANALVLLTTPSLGGHPTSDVIRPWLNTKGLYQRTGNDWIIDFEPDSTLEDAVLYEAPFAIVEAVVKPKRTQNRRQSRACRWWIHGDPQKKMRRLLAPLRRYLVTGTTAKHRIFVWLPFPTLPDSQLIAFAVEDDYTFGVLHSRFHELWALAQGTQLEDRPRYTPTTCFETFPFPTPTDAQHVAIAARDLNALREAWLNPPEWTQSETLIFPATVGGPWHRWIPNSDTMPPGTVADAHYVRTVPKPGVEKLVAHRTLTKLYNERPAWLRMAHARLDEAVAAAYNWPTDLPDQEILSRLLALNLAQAGQS